MRTKRPLREPVREAPGPKLENYITPAGLQRLKDEHRFLMNSERPAVTKVVVWASNGDRGENADYLCSNRRLRQIDSRIRFLTKRIDAAEVVDPAAPQPDVNRRYISWRSPLARALMKCSAGDRVVPHAPKKIEHLEILDVEYAQRFRWIRSGSRRAPKRSRNGGPGLEPGT